MNEQQRNQAAEDFLQRLRTNPELFARWVEMRKDDPGAIGGMVKDELGLETAPSAEDLQAMSDHIHPDLVKHVQAVKPASVSWTGAMFGTQTPG